MCKCVTCTCDGKMNLRFSLFGLFYIFIFKRKIKGGTANGKKEEMAVKWIKWLMRKCVCVCLWLHIHTHTFYTQSHTESAELLAPACYLFPSDLVFHCASWESYKLRSQTWRGGKWLVYRKSNPLMCYMCKFTGLVLEINVFLFYQKCTFFKRYFLMDPKIKFNQGADAEAITAKRKYLLNE